MKLLEKNKLVKHLTVTVCVGLIVVNYMLFSYSFTVRLNTVPERDINTMLLSNNMQLKYLVDPFPGSNDFRDKVSYFLPSLTTSEIDRLLLSQSWDSIVRERREDLDDIF